MTGFVAQLVGMATGTAAGSARLVLPPRFAGPLLGETVVTAAAASYEPLVAPARPVDPRPASHPEVADRTPIERSADVPAPRGTVSAPREVTSPSEPATRGSETVPIPAPGQPQVSREAAPTHREASPPAEPPSRPKPATAAAVDVAVRANTQPAAPAAPVQPAPRRPLSESAVAAVRSNAGPPVINVQIDRIDVRAASAPAPAPQRPPRQPPAPAVSLSDYLRGNGGGRR